MNSRPSWDERFALLARQWSQYSTCKRSKVGAVIWDPISKAILSVGYNDTPIGDTDCGDGGCKICDSEEPVSLDRRCNCLHAEENCILLAARRGTKIEGARMHVTRKPCNSCFSHIKQAGLQVSWDE
jgi:dCMP deaminase